MRNLYIKAGSVAAAAAIVVTAIATNHTATSARTAPASKAAAAKSSAGLPVLKLAYNVGINNWNTTLDPANTAFTNDADTEQLMHAGLVRILPPTKLNGSSKVVLGLADKVSVSRDKKTYTFHIRKNARFSNGHQVTAQDVVFSIARAAGKDVDPQEADTYDNLIQGLHAYNQGQATKISGLKAINSKTLQVKITKPAAYFLTAFAYSSNLVLDPTSRRMPAWCSPSATGCPKSRSKRLYRRPQQLSRSSAKAHRVIVTWISRPDDRRATSFITVSPAGQRYDLPALLRGGCRSRTSGGSWRDAHGDGRGHGPPHGAACVRSVPPHVERRA